jgi:membrane-associated phospholipid phosphatase
VPATILESIHGEVLLRACATHAGDPLWLAFWKAVSFLGQPTFFTIALPVLYALCSRAWASRFAVGFLTSAFVSEWMKALVARPRLDLLRFGLAGPLESGGAVDSFAFPSGHVVTGIVVWGWIALRSPSRLVRAACIALIVLLAASRVALLRHDLLDVAGGLAVGAAVLAALAAFDRRLVQRLAGLPWVELAGLWLVVGIAAQAAAQLRTTAIVLGGLWGVGAGAAWSAERGLADAPPSALRALLAAAVSVLVVGGIRAAAQRWALDSAPGLFLLFGLAGIWIGALEQRWGSRRPGRAGQPGAGRTT